MSQFFSNFALFLAQKVEYLKNYITYGGNILEGLYYWFCGSGKKIVKIYPIVKKFVSPIWNLSKVVTLSPYCSYIYIYIYINLSKPLWQ